MLRALGYRFYDAEGAELIQTLDILERAVMVSDRDVVPAIRNVDISVAVDVDNPLYGERGAACVYAPQKGADSDMVLCLDAALRHYAELGDGYCGYPASDIAGVGAAGGVGYAFVAFLGCALTSGIELLLDVIHFEASLVGATLVVTGEGRIDAQTLMGKAPSGVLRYAERYGVECIAVGGGVAWCDELRGSGFSAIYASKPDDMPLIEAMKPAVACDNLRAVGRIVAEAAK
jgi:glycerate kinase